MKKRAAILILTLIISLFTTAAAWKSIHAQTEDNTQPPGDWKLSSGPYSGSESFPLFVIAARTDGEQGLLIDWVKVKNRTDKDITSFKFRWFIFQDQDPDHILLEGLSPLVEVPLVAGEVKAIDFPVVKFVKIYKPLERNGMLSGAYRLEIMAGEINYEDGSTWRYSKKKKAHASKKSQQNACSKMVCEWDRYEQI